MPSWYVHMQAAAQTMQTLKDKRPVGSPLTQQQADALFTAAHDNRNYLAVGAVAPDLFFLLPDYMGAEGKGVLALVNFVLSTWKVVDEQSQLVNSLSGGMIGEVSQVLGLLAQSVDNYALGLAGQMVDVLGLMTSGTQKGVADSGLYWSDMFHYRKTYQFARQLYANA